MNVASCSRLTTNVISSLHECKKCVHAQKPYSSQAFTHESSKAGVRGKEKKRQQGRGQEADRNAAQVAQQNKNTAEELNQGLPRHS